MPKIPSANETEGNRPYPAKFVLRVPIETGIVTLILHHLSTSLETFAAMVYNPQAQTVQPILQTYGLWAHKRCFIVSVSPFLSSLLLPRLYRQETLWSRDCTVLYAYINGQRTNISPQHRYLQNQYPALKTAT